MHTRKLLREISDGILIGIPGRIPVGSHRGIPGETPAESPGRIEAQIPGGIAP